MSGYAFLEIPVFDSSDHLIGGAGGDVSLQLRHVQNGNTGHILHIDYAVLIDGFSTTTNSDHK